MKTGSRFARAGILFILSLTGVLMALGGLEIGLRLFAPPAVEPTFENYGQTYICSPTLGWVGRPSYQGVINREEYTHPFRFNAQGMYDTEHPLQKPAHVFRILWLGDSFAQALQVDEAQTAHQQLEDWLNQKLGGPERSFEVISAGVMGWGTGQQLVYYREQGRFYQPDLVLLLFFMGNDLNDNLPGHALTVDGFNCFAPYFPVCAGQLDPAPWYYLPGLSSAWDSCLPVNKWIAANFSWLQQNSYLWARLEPLLLAHFPRRTYGQNFALTHAALYLPLKNEEVDYAWRVTEGLLTQFKQEVGANGSQFAVAVAPPKEVIWLAQFTPAQRELFYQDQPIFRPAQIDYPNQRLVGFLADRQIPRFDLQPHMIDYMGQTGATLYLNIDRHWTVEGNRLVAEMLGHWLSQYITSTPTSIAR